MPDSPGFQTYATYYDAPSGALRWLEIGPSPTEALIAELQIEQWGKEFAGVVVGKPRRNTRLRKPAY